MRHPAVVVLVTLFVAAAARAAGDIEVRLTPAESRDLLEPWTLEYESETAEPLLVGQPVPVAANPDTVAAHTAAPLRPAPPADDSEVGGSVGREKVLVVRCRQLLVGQRRAAERLARLLRAGAPLEDARKAIGSIDIDDRTRDYAVEDLQPDLRTEVETLPEGAWSTVRDWNGRAALFQVVSKQTRERRSIPELGAGLGTDEQNRLAREQRPIPPSRPRPANDETSDLEGAEVVNQITPEYPEGATKAGEVTILVTVGRSDEVTTLETLSSTDPVFDQAAQDAARRSTYRAQRQSGVPVGGTVRVTFRFPAPQTQQPHD